MTDRVFFDTNVLIYAFDQRNDQKRKRAVELLSRYHATHSSQFVISTQVVQEFYSIATRKGFLPGDEADEIVRDLLKTTVVVISPGDILHALVLRREHGLSFWDALILSCAVKAGAPILYSEDFQHDRVYAGVRVVNPFLQAA